MRELRQLFSFDLAVYFIKIWPSFTGTESKGLRYKYNDFIFFILIVPTAFLLKSLNDLKKTLQDISLQSDSHNPLVWKRQGSLCNPVLSTIRPTVQTAWQEKNIC